MATAVGALTLSDVYHAFKKITGLDWFPLGVDLEYQAIFDLIEAVISQHGVDTNKAHVTAQEDQETPLSGVAINLIFAPEEESDKAAQALRDAIEARVLS